MFSVTLMHVNIRTQGRPRGGGGKSDWEESSDEFFFAFYRKGRVEWSRQDNHRILFLSI